MASFFAAWPERDLAVDAIRASLAIGYDDDEYPALVVALGVTGSETTVEWNGDEDEPTRIIDDIAVHLAEEAEGDRWIARGGWQDYRQ